MAITLFPRINRHKGADTKTASTTLPVDSPAQGGKTFSPEMEPMWNSDASQIQVEEESELPVSLENAALMYAHGNISGALASLQHALEGADRKHPLTWMCLFDLYVRGNNRAAYDDLVPRFVAEFERSAPSWGEMAAQDENDLDTQTLGSQGRSVFRKNLTEPTFPGLNVLIETSKRKDLAGFNYDVDITDLNSVSDSCGMLLAGALAAMRRKGSIIHFRGLASATRRLAGRLQAGTATNKGQWYLSLELMQWLQDTKPFEDLAVDFAVTFGISPPSMESLTPQQRAIVSAAPAQEEKAATESETDDIVWSGELKGSTDAALRTLLPEQLKNAHPRVNARQVSRIDFICGSAIANAVAVLKRKNIDVGIVGATPIIQAVLVLTGTPSSHFVKR